jgi:hypothetical protein
MTHTKSHCPAVLHHTQALLCVFVDAQPEGRRPSPGQLRRLAHAVRLHQLSTSFLADVAPLVAWLYGGNETAYRHVVANRMAGRQARADGCPAAWLPTAPKRKVSCGLDVALWGLVGAIVGVWHSGGLTPFWRGCRL